MSKYFAELESKYLTNENLAFSHDKWLIRDGKNLLGGIEDKPGVYAIYLDGRLSYIGQSNTPRFRFVQHRVQHYESYHTPWGLFDELYIKIKYPSKYGKESMIEKRLIRKLEPRFNKYKYQKDPRKKLERKSGGRG